jgi:hypothetical protein
MVAGLTAGLITWIAPLVWLQLSLREPMPALWPGDYAEYWRWLVAQMSIAWWPMISIALGWLATLASLLGFSTVASLAGRLKGKAG